MRAKILEPNCDIPEIVVTHSCISELCQKRNLQIFGVLEKQLSNFYSVDRLYKLATIVPKDDNIRAAEILINRSLQLKNCLQRLPDLRQTLELLQSQSFCDINESLQDPRYGFMLEHIDKVISKDLVVDRSGSGYGQIFQRINCIQPGVDDLLDLSRNIYSELMTEVRSRLKKARRGSPHD